MITVKQCPQADKDHKEERRNYAHTHHIKGNVICVAGAFLTLPMEIQMALLAHEVGHLLAGNKEHSEKEANRLANMFFDIDIQYQDTLFGRHLQIISTKDMRKVWDWIDNHVQFKGALFASTWCA